MNTENDLIDLLRGAGLDAVIAEEDPEFYRRHFRPLPDLAHLEDAQADFQEIRGMLADTKSYRAWLRSRPRHMHPLAYFEGIGAAMGLLNDLTQEFGADILAAKPTLREQRERPN